MSYCIYLKFYMLTVKVFVYELEKSSKFAVNTDCTSDCMKSVQFESHVEKSARMQV